MKTKSTNILYIYTERRSFVQKDLRLLEAHFNVRSYRFTTSPKFYTPLSFLKQFFFLLFFGWRYDHIACFFAGYHSVLPAWFARLTGKSCVLFLGGTECFNYPSFNYGNFTRKWYARATCLSAHNASLLVPVSSNLIESQSAYYTTDSAVQGIYHWCRPLKTPYQVIPLEYNSDQFFPRDVVRQPNSFITVAFGIEGTSFVRKGIDKVIMIARHCPDYTFTIIGCEKSTFPVEIPTNVEVLPPVPYDTLPEHYSRHRFYLQLSIAEGFPSAICEAMLCGCIPIGSDVAAIPAIISSNGYLVARRDDTLILETVRQAVEAPDKERLSNGARRHIMETFGAGKRSQALYTLFAHSK